ncbi:hypothetical protein LQG66_37130 [Bradyrhizobium ontarionense]|uniref:Uncharacterized protein n=1 Tax=Bradyrhizobium ontarionense TaxID=2898149 RepID=A0ABY3RDK8_9BRAD|nr:hypothetical protein [Bradyrhizobium sp. A19]UFZ04739.1 hypothetical protein LQG66_37130 [Bradyrhizobium sp. A19]
MPASLTDHSQDRMPCAILQIGRDEEKNSSFGAAARNLFCNERAFDGAFGRTAALTLATRKAPEMCLPFVPL